MDNISEYFLLFIYRLSLFFQLSTLKLLKDKARLFGDDYWSFIARPLHPPTLADFEYGLPEELIA